MPPAIIDNYQPGNEIETEMTLDVDDLLDVSSSDSEDESSAQADPDFTPETGSKKVKTDDIPEFEYKKRAVDFWKDTEGKSDKNGKIQGRRKFSSVSSKFSRCRSERTLGNWDKEVLIGGGKFGKLKQVSKYVLDRFNEARNSNNAVSDHDLAQWAHEHSQTLSVPNFQVDDTWVDRFKKRNKLASRMITKVVSKNYNTEKKDLQKVAEEFVKRMRRKYEDKDPSLLMNTDQTGFRREICSHRTIAVKGQRHVLGVAGNINATTHSYTIQPLISADGKFQSPMLVVLQEASTSTYLSRGFGPNVWKDIQPLLGEYDNLYAWGSVSGKCTNQIIKDWFENVFFPYNPDGTVLLADAFGCYNQRYEARDPIKYDFEMIPEKTTGMIQPLDVYFNRPYKNLLNTISVKASRIAPGLKIHDRKEQLRMHSLNKFLFEAPKFSNLIKYSFAASGYIDGEFEFPVPKTYCFPIPMNNCELEIDSTMCNDPGFIRCSHCERFLCFHHFYLMYHRKFCVQQ